MRTGWICSAALMVGLTPITSLAQSEFDALRTDVRTELPDPPDSPSDTAKRDDCDDDPWDDDDDSCDDDDGDSAVLGGLLFAISSPFWAPPMIIGDTFDRSGYFPTHPYQFDQGYMIIGDDARYEYGYDCSGRCAARAASEFGTNLSGIDWLGTRILVETTPRLGLDADFRLLSEERFPRANDHLWLGDANLLFRFAQDELVQMRTGVGFNYLSDPIDTNFGFNFTYGGDWYFARPWVVSAEFDVGWLGEATVIHLRGTVGANWRFAEAYLGYDYYDIGRVNMGGMVAGVRLWF
jgi:hypothetical protein